MGDALQRVAQFIHSALPFCGVTTTPAPLFFGRQ